MAALQAIKLRRTRVSCLQIQLSVAILMTMNTLQRAYQHTFRSRASFAAALGVSAEAVRKWERSRAPAERCIEIEKLSGGAVSRYDLRPDVFGPAPTEQAA